MPGDAATSDTIVFSDHNVKIIFSLTPNSVYFLFLFMLC